MGDESRIINLLSINLYPTSNTTDNQFSVGSASEEYPLTVRGFTGVGTDWFISHPQNGMKFTTPDNYNDKYSGGNCAAKRKSEWWYNDCTNIRGVGTRGAKEAQAPPAFLQRGPCLC